MNKDNQSIIEAYNDLNRPGSNIIDSICKKYNITNVDVKNALEEAFRAGIELQKFGSQWGRITGYSGK